MSRFEGQPPKRRAPRAAAGALPACCQPTGPDAASALGSPCCRGVVLQLGSRESPLPFYPPGRRVRPWRQGVGKSSPNDALQQRGSGVRGRGELAVGPVKGHAHLRRQVGALRFNTPELAARREPAATRSGARVAGGSPDVADCGAAERAAARQRQHASGASTDCTKPGQDGPIEAATTGLYQQAALAQAALGAAPGPGRCPACPAPYRGPGAGTAALRRRNAAPKRRGAAEYLKRQVQKGSKQSRPRPPG